MRLAAALALALMLPSFSVAAPTVTLMTYNIRHGLANDGPNRWELRKHLLLDVIREHEPDIAGMQEVHRFQADWLDAKLAEHDWYGVPRTSGSEGTAGMDEIAPLFFRPGGFRPLALGTVWLSETPEVWASTGWDASMPRTATWGRFRDEAAGREMWVVNVHFDHLGAVARLESARLLAQWIDDNVADGVPCVLMGDFNAWGGTSEPWKALVEEGGFRDAWTEAPERTGPAATWTAFKAPDPDSAARIDWILWRGPLRVLRAESATRQEGERWASDHMAVVAEFEWLDNN